MSKIILYTADTNTATGIREATFDEIMTGARQALSSHVRKGTVFSSPKITAREVVKEALGHNAAAVIIAHNHPSGIAEPSAADEAITRRLREALSLVDIRVLDHILGGFLVVTPRGKTRKTIGVLLR